MHQMAWSEAGAPLNLRDWRIRQGKGTAPLILARYPPLIILPKGCVALIAFALVFVFVIRDRRLRPSVSRIPISMYHLGSRLPRAVKIKASR
jgi:hypothetical protein